MNRETGSGPAGVGALSVMTALLAVTLAVFALLTLSAARADLALSTRAAETVSAWYVADREGARALRAFEKGGGQSFACEIAVDEHRVLHIAAYRGADGRAVVTEWRTSPAGEAGDGDFLPVWQGEE